MARSRGRTRGSIARPPDQPPPPPPPSTAKTYPRGPVNGFAQAADFYDSVGINHHPEYLFYNSNNTTGQQDSVAISRMRELGIRHVRLGMYSPADHGAFEFFTGSGRFGAAIANANATRTAAQQPLTVLWGTTEEPAYEILRGSAAYTITNTNGTFLRPLDGPAGNVPAARFGISDYPFVSTGIKDDLNRATIGNNWTNDPFGESTTPAQTLFSGGWNRYEWQAGSGGRSTMYWNAGSYSTKIEAYATLRNKATQAGAYIRTGIIQQPGAGTADGYVLQVRTDTNAWSILRYTNGSATVIAGPATSGINAPWDRFGIEVKAGVVTGYRYDNGAGRYTAVVSAADTTYQFAGGSRLVLGANDDAQVTRFVDFGGGDTTLLESAGDYFNQGWITCAALQGPNEPDNNRGTFWDSIRATLRALKDGVAARPSQPAVAGADYIDSTTGRIAQGPAHAPQIPIIGFHCVGNNWAAAGSYTDGQDIDVGCRHTYWGGHGPRYVENRDQWVGTTSYTGLPRFCTETGYYQRPGYDGGPASDGLHPGWVRDANDGQRHCPEEVSGEYLLRTLIQHYAELNIRRTYIYKLCDEFTYVNPPANFGCCDLQFNQRASFYAIKNLLAHVGFVQAPTSQPITVTNDFVPGANVDLDAGSSSGAYSLEDRLVQVVLQRSSTEYLILVYRQRDIWSRGYQAYRNVADAKNVTFTVPASVLGAGVAHPSKNSIKDPVDGVTYATPANDGMTYAPLTLTTVGANKTLTVRMGGLTQVIRLTTQPAPDPTQAPTGLAGVASHNSVRLTWNAVAGATGYEVFRDGTQIGSV